MAEKKLPISLVMVIYNNEDVLERALKSSYDLVDDIVIVHDGKCSDKSLSIARKYTTRVYVRKHIGSPEGHRPFTYKNAKNDWILQLDADEYLSSELRKEIPKLIKENVGIYNFSWPVFYHGRDYFWNYKGALFQKKQIYYIGSVHEYVKPISNDIKIKFVDFPLMHRPTNENISLLSFRKKWINWAKIQALQLTGKFDNLSKWNYAKDGWDYPNNIRLKYPIIIGAIGSSVYHFTKYLKNFIKYHSIYFLKQGVLMVLYFLCVYFYVFKLQHQRK